MTEIEVRVPDGVELQGAERAIENVCEAAGLGVTMKGSLAKCPGCIHWHYKKVKLRGTLEVTLWKERRRIWFSIQSGRRGDWIQETVNQLKSTLESKL